MATSCSRRWRLGTAATFAAVLAIAAGAAGLQPAPARAQDKPQDISPDEVAGRQQDVDKLKSKLADTERALADAMKRLDVLKAQSAAVNDELKSREVAIQARTDQQAYETDRTRQEQALRALPKGGDAAPGDAPAADAARKLLYDQALARHEAIRDTFAPNAAGDAAVAGAAGNALRGSPGGLDLVTLAISYIDAVGNARTARARLDRTMRLAREKSVSNLEAETDKASLDTAELKVQLLRGVLEIALNGAKADFSYAEELARKGFESRSQVAEAQARLQILELILKSGQQQSPQQSPQPK